MLFNAHVVVQEPSLAAMSSSDVWGAERESPITDLELYLVASIHDWRHEYYKMGVFLIHLKDMMQYIVKRREELHNNIIKASRECGWGETEQR